MTTMYSEVIKLPTRFIGTNDAKRYRNWIDKLDEMLIRYRDHSVESFHGKPKFDIELIGYTQEEIDDIKEKIGYRD